MARARCLHLVFIAALGLLLCGCGAKRVRVRAFQQVPTLLTVADLIYQPEAYNRQVVTVTGWYRTGSEVTVLQPGYSYHGGTVLWVYDENHEDEPTGPPLRDPPKKRKSPLTKQEKENQRVMDSLWGKTIPVVFEGEFRCGTGFGHQSQYHCALFLDRVLAVGD